MHVKRGLLTPMRQRQRQESTWDGSDRLTLVSAPNLHPARAADNDLVGDAKEEARSDDASAAEQLPLQTCRIGNPIEPAVQDVVPLVCHKGPPIGIGSLNRFSA